ncbi:hypothetical protein Bpfe_028542 [Biomphalaria pfeifferi]|uniref:Uncharacterized protein n=1 Tax=Biomphalaria pfeifferi TaxID=112525 RepID=A0AAD8EWI6_BIOPF|nr:hypothetical protein Bpfe_028542 [Biomphalaria pfeifferi]
MFETKGNPSLTRHFIEILEFSGMTLICLITIPSFKTNKGSDVGGMTIPTVAESL